MAKTLHVSAADGHPLAVLRQHGRTITVEWAAEDVRARFEQLAAEGLGEWTPTMGWPDTDRYYRFTDPGDPEFLPRLADYLRRCYRFAAVVSGDESGDVLGRLE